MNPKKLNRKFRFLTQIEEFRKDASDFIKSKLSNQSEFSLPGAIESDEIENKQQGPSKRVIVAFIN